MTNMLHPDPWQGIATECRIKDMEWIQNLGKNTWCDLWLQWPHQKQLQLPKDFNLYVVSFHLEAVDLKWLWQQSQHILSPIIVLTDGACYDCPLPKNVQIEKFYWWHQQIECIRK